MYHEFNFFDGDQTIRCLVSDLADCERIQNILDYMSEDRQECVLAYMECIENDIEHAVDDVDNNDDICLYGYLNETLEEYARDLVNEGAFGDVADTLKDYIDYERLASALEDDGYYETSYGILYCH